MQNGITSSTIAGSIARPILEAGNLRVSAFTPCAYFFSLILTSACPNLVTNATTALVVRMLPCSNLRENKPSFNRYTITYCASQIRYGSFLWEKHSAAEALPQGRVHMARKLVNGLMFVPSHPIHVVPEYGPYHGRSVYILNTLRHDGNTSQQRMLRMVSVSRYAKLN